MCYQHHRTDVFDLGALVRLRGRGGFAITVLEHRRLRFVFCWASLFVIGGAQSRSVFPAGGSTFAYPDVVMPMTCLSRVAFW